MAHARLRLSPVIRAEIIAHARAGAPEEVCGLLGGQPGHVTTLIRGRNEAADPRMRYQLDGETLLQQFVLEERGEALLALYHSHPTDAAYPSALDAAYAFYPDAVYVICSLQEPESPVLRGYRLVQHTLTKPPAGVRPVTGEPGLAAQQHAAGYDLVWQEAGGRTRWLRVTVEEVALA